MKILKNSFIGILTAVFIPFFLILWLYALIISLNKWANKIINEYNEHFKFGIATRIEKHNSDYLICMLGFVNKWFNLTYSYDFTLSKLSNSYTGCHEITTILKFNYNKTEKYKVSETENF